jgi:hypothetical protein
MRLNVKPPEIGVGREEQALSAMIPFRAFFNIHFECGARIVIDVHSNGRLDSPSGRANAQPAGSGRTLKWISV